MLKTGGTCNLTLHFEWLEDVTYLAGCGNNVVCRRNVVLLVLWDFVSLENVCACPFCVHLLRRLSL